MKNYSVFYRKLYLLLVPLVFLMISFVFIFVSNAKNAETKVSDAAILTKIEAKYVADKLLNPFNIKVQVDKGVVELIGLVDTEIQFERAITLAISTEGVEKIEARNLKIKESKTPIQDSVITAKIKGLILKQKIFGNELEAAKISVETQDRIVYLTGKLKNKEQKKQVIDIALSIENVKAIIADFD